MKILSFLNVSNRENPGSDSGVIFHRLLFSECIQRGHKVYIASPFNVKISGAEYINFEPGYSKYDVRFRFDWDKCKNIIEKTKPDIIFCHQIELTSHFRALITTMGIKAKIVTYYHYIPAMEIKQNKIIWDQSLDNDGLAEIIFLKILSAIRTTDYFFVTSVYSKNFLLKMSKKYNFFIDEKKINIMPPPADDYFLKGKQITKPINKKVVLYSSRLYKQYGTDFFLDIVKYYHNYDKDVKFVVTDFFGNKSEERKKLDSTTEKYRQKIKKMKNIEIYINGDIRKVYRDNIIANSRIIFGPYRVNANWSMGMVDANMMGIPGIGPKIASFSEFMPEYLLYKNKKEAIFLMDKLLNDDKFWKKAAQDCKYVYKKFSSQRTADVFLNKIIN